MIKVLILDLHGVLIKKFPKEEYETKVIRLLKKHKINSNVYKLMRKIYGTASATMEHFNLKKEYLELLDSLSTTIQKDEELIKILENISCKLYIATDTSRKNALSTLKNAGFKIEMFANIVTGSDVKHAKPNIEMYQNILKREGVNPSEVLVIGDRTSDLIPAEKIGMQGILADYEFFKEIIKSEWLYEN